MTYKLVLIFALILIPALAFVALFGNFTSLDDEGYSIAVIRGVTSGAPLYTKQFDFHGPLPFLAKALVLRALGLPVTQETMRVWVMGIWLLSCSCLSLAIWYLTRNPFLSACAVIVTGAHLFALRFNPGHPEDFVVLFMSLVILVSATPTSWISESIRVAILAGIGGILAATKINVGLFLLFGLSLWVLALLPRGGAWKLIAVVFAVGVTLFPLVLMRTLLLASWQLALVTTLGIFTTCLAVLRLPIPARLGWKHVGIAACSFFAVTAAVLIVAQMCGSRVQDVFNQTVLAAAAHSGLNVRPVFSWKAIPATIACVIVAWVQGRRIVLGTTHAYPSPAVTKVALSLMALCFTAMLHFEFYMPFVGVVCWLIVFPDGCNAINDRSLSARLFIASIAAFQTMQVFPIAGAQTAWSTLPLCVCCLLLLYDGLSELSLGPVRVLHIATRSVQAVAGVSVFLLMILTGTLWLSYFHTPSIGFGGSNLIHIPMATTAEFDWVVANVTHYCDGLVTEPGLDSFVLWSSRPGSQLVRRSPILLVDWPFTMPEDRQIQASSSLAAAARVCGVYSKRLTEWWTDQLPPNARAQLAALPLVAYLQHLEPIRTVGDYEIRVNRAVKESWTADYLLDGVRDMNGNRSAVGVPAALLRDGSDPDLTFSFQTHAGGPLVSLQAPKTDSDDQPYATESLIYISLDGSLMLRSGGTSFAAVHANLADGNWHELQLKQEHGRWSVLVDGLNRGFVEEFLANAPGYLQLGPAYVQKCPELGTGWRTFQGSFRDVRVRYGDSQATFSARATN